ncbi:hypothetical protein [Phenylobacterium sp.]|uniref:hypothetical protein n=1 Tax=Phenylobacterium sp. TaxID=1871053 RepID=UPI0025F7EF5C|nr:hypothetical protein [Phenylobacterium sp.]MBX3486185.1 hypothetical protein [Phenylobacterium sp.]MCW5759008.1 hypothetical protein [Phenylobacterium sp.]
MSAQGVARVEREPQACETRLFPAERLLFYALKAWSAARLMGERPHGHVGEVLAAKASPRASSLFLAWIQAVEAASARPLRLTCSHCGGMSTDAQRLIVACGLSLVDRPLAEALLEPIVREPGMVIMLSRQLNNALSAAGWSLPARGLEPDAHTTLH